MAAGAGILIVGEAVGFGGKLIRTVSFLGCTLEASAGFAAAAPAGGFGFSSDICVKWGEPSFATAECQSLIEGSLNDPTAKMQR